MFWWVLRGSACTGMDIRHHLDHLQGHIQVRDGVKSRQGTVEGDTGLSDLLEGMQIELLSPLKLMQQ